MATPNHVSIVQSGYAEVARGDIPAFLQRLAPDVRWSTNVDRSLPGADKVPCYEPGQGIPFVASYFQKLSASYEMHVFRPLSVLEGGDEVLVRLEVDFTIKPTGRRIRSQVLHHWTFDSAGKIVAFLDIEDTLAFVHAWA